MPTVASRRWPALRTNTWAPWAYELLDGDPGSALGVLLTYR